MNFESIIEPYTCAYCGTWIGPEPEYTIHRDGYDEGPEVPLCCSCGERSGPSCHTIWSRISRTRGVHRKPVVLN